MKHKRLVTLLGSICLTLVLAAMPFLAACPAPAPPEEEKPTTEPIVLKGVTFCPIGHAEATPFRELMERIEKKSNGELTIDCAGTYDVIHLYDQAEAVRTGVIDMALTFVAVYSEVIPEVQSLTYSEIEPWEERERGYFDYMVDLHEKMNLRYLGRGCFFGPGFYFLSNKKIEKLEDFAGMKFCTGPVFVSALRELGAGAVVMPTPDKYGAMERGLVDGINTPITLGADMHMYEVSKYLLDEGLLRADVTMIMNLDKWNSLPEHLQDLLMDEMAALEHEMKPYFAKMHADAKQMFKDEGVEFISLSAEDSQKLQEIVREACWADLAKTISPEDYTKLREFLSK